MRYAVVIFTLMLSCPLADGQNLVGYKADEIRSYVLRNRSDLRNVEVRNNEYKYLKYIDSSDNHTILFFLSADSVCRSIRMIYDPALKDAKIKELNSSFKKIDGLKWIDNRDGKEFLVEMNDSEWSLVVTIGPKQ